MKTKQILQKENERLMRKLMSSVGVVKTDRKNTFKK